jgi:hypothetical protein
MMLGRVFALDSDQALVRTALQGVAESLDQISANRQKLNARDSVNWPTLDNLRVNEEQVLDAASARLMATLPASKASKLDNYVQEYVKRRIVLFGSLPTP